MFKNLFDFTYVRTFKQAFGFLIFWNFLLFIFSSIIFILFVIRSYLTYNVYGIIPFPVSFLILKSIPTTIFLFLFINSKIKNHFWFFVLFFFIIFIQFSYYFLGLSSISYEPQNLILRIFMIIFLFFNAFSFSSPIFYISILTLFDFDKKKKEIF